MDRTESINQWSQYLHRHSSLVEHQTHRICSAYEELSAQSGRHQNQSPRRKKKMGNIHNLVMRVTMSDRYTTPIGLIQLLPHVVFVVIVLQKLERITRPRTEIRIGIDHMQGEMPCAPPIRIRINVVLNNGIIKEPVWLFLK